MLARLLAHVKGLLRRNQVEAEVDEELRFHLEMEIQANVARGMTPAEARRIALRDLGGVTQTKEAVREVRWTAVDGLWRDVRYAIRTLARVPTFCVSACLVLALGIGANTAIFSVVHAVLLRPLPYSEPDRIVRVFESNPALHVTAGPVSPASLLAWRDQSRTLAAVAEISASGTGEFLSFGVQSELVQVAHVSEGFFDLLGVRPVAGQAGNGYALSFDFWRSRFACSRAVVGSTVRIEGATDRIPPVPVVAVMPSSVDMPAGVQVWAIAPRRPSTSLSRGERSSRYLQVIARLKPGVALEQARSELGTISRRLARDFPDSHTGWSPSLVALPESVVGGARSALLAVYGASGLLLMLACVSVANLTRARAVTRHRELAIRLALGASRWALVRQASVESLVLSIIGGAAGLLLAAWAINVIVSHGPSVIPRLDTVRVDRVAVAVSVILIAFTSIIVALSSLLRGQGGAIGPWLRVGHHSARKGHVTGRDVAVIAQIAMALVLLVTASLLITSVRRLSDVALGFEPDNVITVQLRHPIFPQKGEVVRHYPTPRFARVTREVVQQVRGLGGVSAVGTIADAPLSRPPRQDTGWLLDAPGLGSALFARQRPAVGAVTFRASTQIVSGDFFRTLQIPILQGRPLSDADVSTAEQVEEDDPSREPGVAVVSIALARRLWPGREPVGRYIAMENGGFKSYRVVGVAGDVRFGNIASEPEDIVYLAYSQQPELGFTLLVRTTQDGVSFVPVLRSALRNFGTDLAIGSFRPMREIADAQIAVPRFGGVAVSLFGCLGLCLAAGGTYGLLAFFTAKRTSEIAIRMALGAQQKDVRRMVLSHAFRLAAWGLLCGLVGAAVARRLVRSLLFGVSATEPVAFLFMTATLTVVVLLASLIPACRAARIDPILALRQD
jgi:predicted permease